MAEDLRLRAAGPDDAQAIREVLSASFSGNAKARAEVMAWQYWENPFGPAVSWVAETDGGRIVAHYAGIRYPGILEGAPAPLALGVDAATHPEFRGLGLFEQLARAVYLAGGQAGIPVTYCLPNPNSLRGFQKAGGQDLGGAKVLVAPLDPRWVATRFGLPRPLAALARSAFRLPKAGEAEVTELPPVGLDELWAAVAPQQANGVARHAGWWDWRYARRPERPYVFVEARRRGRLVGAAAALAREDLGGIFLCLLELLAEDAGAARALVGRLVATAAGPLGAVGLATTALAGTSIYAAARQAGLRALPARLQPQPIHVGVVDNLAALPDLSRRKWSLAWGDLDHI